jgi:hypothetical protein
LKSLTVFVVNCTLLIVAATAQSDKADDVSRWKTFFNRAGWSIKYPRNWKVNNCHSCPDPTAPNVFVFFDNPKTDESVMVDQFVDKPGGQGAEQWLKETSVTTNLNPQVGTEWMNLAGERALKVITRNRDSKECDTYYVTHASKTFAIRIDRNTPSYQLYIRMLSTFKFID